MSRQTDGAGAGGGAGGDGWVPQAYQALLALFRLLARRKTTKVIELLVREMQSPVTREIVIKGYITASAKVTRYRLVEPLRAEGINPDDYREDRDYE